jgi:hypothetical protein
MFLSGTRFEPQRAGIRATMVLAFSVIRVVNLFLGFYHSAASGQVQRFKGSTFKGSEVI